MPIVPSGAYPDPGTASVAIPAGVAGLGAIGGATSGKGGSGPSIPGFFGRPAKALSRDILLALQSGNFSPGVFDPGGSFVGGSLRSAFTPGSNIADRAPTFNEKALLEAQNFFSTLFSNPDINQAIDVFRQASAAPNPETGLISDPLFKTISERRLAEASESARRTGGLFSTSAQESFGRTANELIGEQQVFEDERRRKSAATLFDLLFQRGQAGFLPTQTLASILSTIGGGAPQLGGQTFSNAKGQAGGITGQALLSTGEAFGNKGSGGSGVV